MRPNSTRLIISWSNFVDRDSFRIPINKTLKPADQFNVGSTTSRIVTPREVDGFTTGQSVLYSSTKSVNRQSIITIKNLTNPTGNLIPTESTGTSAAATISVQMSVPTLAPFTLESTTAGPIKSSNDNNQTNSSDFSTVSIGLTTLAPRRNVTAESTHGMNTTSTRFPSTTIKAETVDRLESAPMAISRNQTTTKANVSTNSLAKQTPTAKPTSFRRPRPTSSTTRRPVNKYHSTVSEIPDWNPNWAFTTTTQRPYETKRDCGRRPMQREGRVVGGRDSQLGEFPWSVLIRETTLLGFFVKTKCGGVLIDLKWVLTAAHCQPGMFGSLAVVVGEFDLVGGKSNKFKPIVKKVKRMIVHRDYNPSNFDNDIALLELESPFQVQPHVVPICLPEKDEDFLGQPAMVAGWGKLSFGGPVPSVLQVAKLPVIGNKQCQEMYHNSGHMKLISDSFLCAGYANGGQDSCEGDSGGPLQAQRNDSKWVLVGTVSHGIKCAEPNLPGIYIRTAAYLPWIKAVTYHQDQNKRYGHRRLANIH